MNGERSGLAWAGRASGLAGVLVATLTAGGCAGYDREAYARQSVMTDGRLDVAKVETRQKEPTLMAQAADRLDGSLVGECGVGLSSG